MNTKMTIPWTKIILQFVIFIAVFIILMFGAAGTCYWFRGWLAFGLWIFTGVFDIIVLSRLNPRAIIVRLKYNIKGVPVSDRIIVACLICVFLLIPVIAGLDVQRYHWSYISYRWFPLGLILYILSSWISLWCMLVNPYVESMVRIQTERQHHAIISGHYVIMRHPMYLGAILFVFAFAIMVGSFWAFLPNLLITSIFIIRIIFEERFLFKNLPGYQEYTKRTRYRLIPMIW